MQANALKALGGVVAVVGHSGGETMSLWSRAQRRTRKKKSGAARGHFWQARRKGVVGELASTGSRSSRGQGLFHQHPRWLVVVLASKARRTMKSSDGSMFARGDLSMDAFRWKSRETIDSRM